MNEQNCRILNLIGATILLLAVSAYRQLSIRYLQGDFVRPYIVYAVYIFLRDYEEKSVNKILL